MLRFLQNKRWLSNKSLSIKLEKCLISHVSVQRVPFVRLAQSENAQFTIRK